MISPAAAVKRLTALRTDLLDPVVFYRARREEWTELARATTRATLASLRPPDSDPHVWEQMTDRMVEKIVSTLIDGSEAGVIIALSEEPMDADPANTRQVEITGFKISDIERWVAAGRAKSDVSAPGKNLDARDANKSDLQIAWRVAYALKLQKEGWRGLTAAIRDYLGSEATGEAATLMPEILKAWINVIVPQAVADFRAWVKRRVRSNLRG